MNINKTSNINFKGTVHLEGQARANDPVLRPLIKQLKHHGGHKDVHYYIDVLDADNSIQDIHATYIPKQQVNNFGAFHKHLGGGLDKTKENIQKLIQRANESMWYFQEIRNKEKSIAKGKKAMETLGVIFKFCKI